MACTGPTTTTGLNRVSAGPPVPGKDLVSWSTLTKRSVGAARAPSGTVRLMPDSGRVRRAPALVTGLHRVKGDSGRMLARGGVVVVPGLRSKVPADLGLMLPENM